jgi:hypothetical protein
MTHHRIGRTVSLALTLAAAVMAFMPLVARGQGESAVPFLLIAPNARADGMGEAGGALADDGSAIFWNPGGLAFLPGQEVSLTHSNWLPQFQQSDLFYDFLAYRNHIDSWGGTFAASVTYLSLGEFNETGAGGPEVLSTFKAFEAAVTAGYATKVYSDLGLGVNLRYIHSSLAPFNVQGQDRKGVASTVSFDVAGMWKPQVLEVPGLGDIGDRLTVGLNLSNLGPKLTYIDAEQADPLPTNLRLALSGTIIKSQFNSINVVLDYTRLLVRRHPAPTDSAGNPIGDPPPPDNLPKSLFSAWGDGGLKKGQIAAGVEYWYGEPRLIALRFGYFYESPQYGGRKFLTFGAGVRYDIYGFDFSYLSAIEENNPLGETLRFTLLIAWGGTQE